MTLPTHPAPVATYLDLALRPDVDGLADLVLAMAARVGTPALYDRLLQPALEEVGVRWARDELTVADEHLVTALTEQVITRVATRRSAGPVAVVACTPANEHRVGATMVADALALAGWQPLLLGARTPLADLAPLCAARDVRLVALSVGLEDELTALTAPLAALRAALPADVPVLVGGGAVRRSPGWTPPAAVTVCTSVTDLLAVAPAPPAGLAVPA